MKPVIFLIFITLFSINGATTYNSELVPRSTIYEDENNEEGYDMGLAQWVYNSGYYGYFSKAFGVKNFDNYRDTYLALCSYGGTKGLYDLDTPATPALEDAVTYVEGGGVVRNYDDISYYSCGVGIGVQLTSTPNLTTFTDNSYDWGGGEVSVNLVIDIFEEASSGDIWSFIIRDVAGAAPSYDAFSIANEDYSTVYDFTGYDACIAGYEEDGYYYFANIAVQVAANSTTIEIKKVKLSDGTLSAVESISVLADIYADYGNGVLFKGTQFRGICVGSYTGNGLIVASEDEDGNWTTLDNTGDPGAIGVGWEQYKDKYYVKWLYQDSITYRVFPNGSIVKFQSDMNYSWHVGYDDLLVNQGDDVFTLESVNTKDGETTFISSADIKSYEGTIMITDGSNNGSKWEQGAYIIFLDVNDKECFNGIIINVYQIILNQTIIKADSCRKLDFERRVTYQATSTDAVMLQSIIDNQTHYLRLDIRDFNATSSLKDYVNQSLGSIVNEVSKRQETYWFDEDDNVLTFDDGTTDSLIDIDTTDGGIVQDLQYQKKIFPIKKVHIYGKGILESIKQSSSVTDGNLFQDVYPGINSQTVLDAMAQAILDNGEVEVQNYKLTTKDKGFIRFGKQINLKAPEYTDYDAALAADAYYYTNRVNYNVVTDITQLDISDAFLMNMVNKNDVTFAQVSQKLDSSTVSDTVSDSSTVIPSCKAIVDYHQCCRVTKNNAQTIEDGVAEIVQYDDEDYDYGSNYDSTNHYFVCPVDGVYNVRAMLKLYSAWAAGERIILYVYKDVGAGFVVNTQLEDHEFSYSDTKYQTVKGDNDVLCDAGDKLAIYVWQNSFAGATAATPADAGSMSVTYKLVRIV